MRLRSAIANHRDPSGEGPRVRDGVRDFAMALRPRDRHRHSSRSHMPSQSAIAKCDGTPSHALALPGDAKAVAGVTREWRSRSRARLRLPLRGPFAVAKAVAIVTAQRHCLRVIAFAIANCIRFIAGLRVRQEDS